MEIIKNYDENGKLNLALEGRLDTTTAPSLEALITSEMDKLTALDFDLEKLEYVSSAGLRVFLSAYKKTSAKGAEMTLRNLVPAVMEVFEITGFSNILTIA